MGSKSMKHSWASWLHSIRGMWDSFVPILMLCFTTLKKINTLLIYGFVMGEQIELARMTEIWLNEKNLDTLVHISTVGSFLNLAFKDRAGGYLWSFKSVFHSLHFPLLVSYCRCVACLFSSFWRIQYPLSSTVQGWLPFQDNVNGVLATVRNKWRQHTE